MNAARPTLPLPAPFDDQANDPSLPETSVGRNSILRLRMHDCKSCCHINGLR